MTACPKMVLASAALEIWWKCDESLCIRSITLLGSGHSITFIPPACASERMQTISRQTFLLTFDPTVSLAVQANDRYITPVTISNIRSLDHIYCLQIVVSFKKFSAILFPSPLYPIAATPTLVIKSKEPTHNTPTQLPTEKKQFPINDSADTSIPHQPTAHCSISLEIPLYGALYRLICFHRKNFVEEISRIAPPEHRCISPFTWDNIIVPAAIKQLAASLDTQPDLAQKAFQKVIERNHKEATWLLIEKLGPDRIKKFMVDLLSILIVKPNTIPGCRELIEKVATRFQEDIFEIWQPHK